MVLCHVFEYNLFVALRDDFRTSVVLEHCFKNYILHKLSLAIFLA